MREYLVTFENLTGLNAVKRRMLPLHVQMKRAPRCVSSAGCGFALMCGEDLLAEIKRYAAESSVSYSVFLVKRTGDTIEYLIDEMNERTRYGLS